MPPQNPSAPVTPIAATALRSPIQLIKDAWALYKKQLGTLLMISAVPVVIVAAIIALWALGPLWTVEAYLQTKELSQAVINSAIGIVLGVVLMIIATVWGSAAMLAAVTDSDGNTSLTEAYGKGWKMLGAYIWVSLLTGLCVMAGFILLIIPGFIVAVWLSLSMYVLAVENVRGTDALRKSKLYVQGHWWAVFGRLCVVYLLYVVVAIVVSAIESAAGIPAEIGSKVIGIIMAPFVATYLYLIYQDLKAMKSAVV
jgi:hypothetical protein